LKRYNRLKKDGIIVGEFMHLNPLSFGYESFAEIGFLTDLAYRKHAIELIRNKPFVRLVPAIGKYDIRGQVIAKKLSDLSILVQRVDIKPYIDSVEVLLFSDLNNSPWYPENLILKPEEREHKLVTAVKQKKFEPVELDEKDIGLVKALTKDSRTPFKDIANMLGISTANVIRRYRRLREKNVLNLSSICVDPLKLGYQAIADSYIKIKNKEHLSEVEQQLLQIPNVTFCAKFIGGIYDIRVAGPIANIDDFIHFRTSITSINNIKHAEVYLSVQAHSWIFDLYGWDILNQPWPTCLNLNFNS